MKSFVRAAVFVLMLPVLAAAESSINGGWSGTIAGPDGEQTVLLSLTVDAEQLSGSVIVPGGIEFSIEEGMQAGTLVQFKTVQQTGDAQVVLKWVGTVDGDTIAFSFAPEDGQAATTEFVASRQP